MNGIIVINKPKGISSNMAVSKVKKVLGTKKVGHYGTLDPLATGVLPIAVGKATKLFDYFLTKTKTYIATFTFGKTTDTLDSEGKITQTCTTLPTKHQLIVATKKFLGKTNQIPPKYSAKSVGGVRAYELSRRGIDFELSPKLVTITKFDLLDQLDDTTFIFEIDCSSGTYIRSLARDLGQEVGSLAYMSDLIRTRSGNFTLNQAIELDHITPANVISIDKVLSNLKKVCVDDKFFDKLKNGNAIKVDLIDQSNFLLYCKNCLFGIADSKNNLVKVRINLYGE